jgi:cytochrome c oxidase assembly factor CtaG
MPTTALTWQTAFTRWELPLAAALAVAAAAVGYAWAVRHAHAWPWRRTAWFAAGLAVIVLATGSSINAYSRTLFAMHMVQHLLLIMVAPTLLLLGRPAALLHAATGIRAGRLRPALRLLTHPMAGFAAYAAVVVGTHLTPFQQQAATIPALHGVEELLYLGSGLLLLLSILGDEPLRAPLTHLTRLALLFAAMVVDTIVGITLLMTPTVQFPAYAARSWGPDALTDLHTGGAIMWVGGDGLMAALVILVITSWVNAPGGGNDLGPWLNAARRSALGADGDGGDGGVGDIDDDEEALRAYNAMLARLADDRRDRPH